MPNLTKIAKWAESLGISRQQGYAAIERCGIPVTDGAVDAEYATHLYHKHTRARTNSRRGAEASASGKPGGVEGGGAPTTYESSRARREEAEALQAEIKAAEMAGLYLVKAEVEAVTFEIARALRDGLANCSRRIAGDVAGLATAEECEEVIEREHRALLASMALSFKSRIGVDVEGASE